MPLQVKIDNGSGFVDYTRYVLQDSIRMEDAINVPTLLTLDMANVNAAFVVPKRSAYIKLVSTKTGKSLFTGFITNTPVRRFLGRSQKPGAAYGFQHQGFRIEATSDEWLLNVKSVPFVPAFVYRTMGQILKDIAEALAPSFYNTTNVDDADTIPYFEYNPQAKWSEIAKEFADSARYRYKVIDKKIYFKPYGDESLGIEYDETKGQGTFNPYTLDTDILSVPPVNDAIVIGDVEPQAMRDDYFIGDGFEADFGLRHEMFRGSSALLLQEDWVGTSFNGSLWTRQDSLSWFRLTGSLNAVAGSTATLGTEYIRATNGVELGGQLILQHGEFFFNGVCVGIIGGLYNSSSLVAANCIAGFDIRAGTSTQITASGAQGYLLQPMVNGQVIGPLADTQPGHHYILQTVINARKWSRYNQVYRTLAGPVFGGSNEAAKGDITFLITDIAPDGSNMVTRYTQENVTLPSFALYALLNAERLNLVANYTLIAQPPQAHLQVASLTGASGASLPVRNPGGYVHYPLGFGLQNQTATVGKAGDVDALQFYADTIPSVGARIRLQSWEAGRAVARVQNRAAITGEQVVSGDDGVRTGIFEDFRPLPRTSDDCDLAGQALVTDRSTVQYDGSYACTSFFLSPSGQYPISGRYLRVNAAFRNINNQNLLVRRVSTVVLSMADEMLGFTIEFGQDLYLEKLLKAFTERQDSVLVPRDSAITPVLQNLADIGTTYLANLVDAKVVGISGDIIRVDLGVAPATGCEVRRTDFGWGRNDLNRIGVFSTQTFTLKRHEYDEVFYLRQVNGPKFSRFSRVFRIVYPLKPQPPGTHVDISNPLFPVVELFPIDDIRNLHGVEIRDVDQVTVLYQKRYLAPADLKYTYTNDVYTDPTATTAELTADVDASTLTFNISILTTDGGNFAANDLVVVGRELVRIQSINGNQWTLTGRGLSGSTAYTHKRGDIVYRFSLLLLFYCFFFNTMWEYSQPALAQVVMQAPPVPSPSYLLPPGDGTWRVLAPAFDGSVLDAERNNIDSMTVSLLHVNEISPVYTTLQTSVASGATTLNVSASASGGVFSAGDLVVIGKEATPGSGEVLEIVSITPAAGGTYDWVVLRSQKTSILSGSTGQAIAHSAGERLYQLQYTTQTFSFPEGFFLLANAEAQVQWEGTIVIPSARVVAMETHVSNEFGNSPTVVFNTLLTNAVELSTPGSLPGLRTGTGGQFTFTQDGQIAVESNPMPDVPVELTASVMHYYAMLRVPSAGSSVLIDVKKDGVVFHTLTIDIGSVISQQHSGAMLPAFIAGSNLSYDITQVGTSEPGQDLTVVIQV